MSVKYASAPKGRAAEKAASPMPQTRSCREGISRSSDDWLQKCCSEQIEPAISAHDSLDRIMATFRWPNDWRTLSAISEEAGLPQGVVRLCIDCNPDLFEPSPMTFMGQSLYRRRDLS